MEEVEPSFDELVKADINKDGIVDEKEHVEVKINIQNEEVKHASSKTENDLYQKELEEFDSMDINGDGKLKKNELDVAQIAFGKSVDKNNDGFISKEEDKKC